MEEKNKGKKIKILAIILISLAIVFAIVTTIILNRINNKYDDLDDKNNSLPNAIVEIID